MKWGRLKPFWQSKAWKESKEKGTGVFSWGESNFFKLADHIPGLQGVGTAIDAGYDALGATAGQGNGPAGGPSKEQLIDFASFASNNQLALYALIGIGAYRILIK